MTFGIGPAGPPLDEAPVQNPVAWHYTGPEGLLGILSSNRLWASDPVILNDRAELKYGFDIVAGEWRSMREDPSIPADVRRFLDETITDSWLSELMESVFLVSASTSPDLSSQWLNYAHNDGFAIGLDRSTMWLPAANETQVIDLSGEAHVPSVGPVWMEIEYDPEQQRATARQMLQVALTIAGRESTEWTRSLLRLQTATGIAIFKHPGFRDEHEIRLAVPRLSQVVRFRASGGRLVPYAEVARYVPDAASNTGRVEKLPIVKIVCAPNSKDATLTTVSRLLRANGYDGVQVERSDLPLG